MSRILVRKFYKSDRLLAISGYILAIQNFISGGFYGKVGKVIGQRWHNTL
jgi:hypothetical protein